MDVRRVAEEKRAPAAKSARHAVMHAIGREPVHAVDFEAKLFERPTGNVAKAQRGFDRRSIVRLLDESGGLGRQRSNEARVAVALHVEYGQEIRVAQVDVNAVADDRAARGDVGNVEERMTSWSRRADEPSSSSTSSLTSSMPPASV